MPSVLCRHKHPAKRFSIQHSQRNDRTSARVHSHNINYFFCTSFQRVHVWSGCNARAKDELTQLVRARNGALVKCVKFKSACGNAGRFEYFTLCAAVERP